MIQSCTTHVTHTSLICLLVWLDGAHVSLTLSCLSLLLGRCFTVWVGEVWERSVHVCAGRVCMCVGGREHDDIIFIAEGGLKIMSCALGVWPWGGCECEGVAMGGCECEGVAMGRV